jgi:hypothetical protein
MYCNTRIEAVLQAPPVFLISTVPPYQQDRMIAQWQALKKHALHDGNSHEHISYTLA